jgi:outer membrane protein assembly factor BamE (lipoprotein component of BamABCDE complex)
MGMRVLSKGEAMKRNRMLSICVVFVAVLGLVQGCSRGPSEEELKMAEFQAQFAELEQAYATLMSLRDEIETAEIALAELEEIGEAKLTEEQQAEFAELPATIDGLTADRETAFEEVQTRLADLLNIGINDYPESSETASALVMYSDEAIFVADDMVAQSGDYKKAIDHLSNAESYFSAAGLTPYHPLIAKIEELDSWRFITQERFDQVKNGMTKDEVVELVGQVYYRNIQENPDRGVETWLYKKREGGAAAFYFKIKTDKVYDKNFDAIAMTTVVED